MQADAKNDGKLEIRSIKVKQLAKSSDWLKITCEVDIFESQKDTLEALHNLLQMSKARQAAEIKYSNIPNCLKYLDRVGLSVSDVDKLNIIHVAGTKGKGSTCKFTESMLRQAGFRTGLFISPHLVTVRERIQINGAPMTEEKFTQYFFEVYDKIVAIKETPYDLPSCMGFLVCMAVYVFIQEGTEAVILEVSLGGRNCNTNIVQSPVATGITTIDFDHQHKLGYTLSEIATVKAGIMKPRVACFTVHNQKEEVLQALMDNANSVKCQLVIAPQLDLFTQSKDIELGIDGSVSKLNAGLAVQLAHHFVRFYRCGNLVPQIPIIPLTTFEDWQLNGLRKCRFQGRYQKVERSDNVTYYLDGAHTVQSIKEALGWFLERTRHRNNHKAIVFYLHGIRDLYTHLEPIITENCAGRRCDEIVICPLALTKNIKGERVYLDAWIKGRAGLQDDVGKCLQLKCSLDGLQVERNTKVMSIVMDSITEVLEHFDKAAIEKGFPIDILVTGSLYLVGGFISLLESHNNE